MNSVLMLVALASAADCSRASEPAEVRQEVVRVRDALARGDDMVADAAARRITMHLACLDELLSPEAITELHLALFVSGWMGGSAAIQDLNRAVRPGGVDQSWKQAAVGDPLLEDFLLEASSSRGEGYRLPPPWRGEFVIDGVSDREKAVGQRGVAPRGQAFFLQVESTTRLARREIVGGHVRWIEGEDGEPYSQPDLFSYRLARPRFAALTGAAAVLSAAGFVTARMTWTQLDDMQGRSICGQFLVDGDQEQPSCVDFDASRVKAVNNVAFGTGIGAGLVALGFGFGLMATF